MKMSLPSFLAITFLATPIFSPLFGSTVNGQTVAAGQGESTNVALPTVAAQSQAADSQDDQGTPRVARLDFLQGDVSFQRAGDKDWVQAVRNLPLLTGDQVYAADRSSATVQLGHGTYVRLFENTALTITDLSEQGVQFEVPGGSVVVQVYRLDEAFGSFEIDTPVAAALIQQDGTYRVQVQDNGETEVATRYGLAEVSTEDGTLKVRAGYRLEAGSKGSGKLDVLAVASFDDWNIGSALDTTIDAGGITTDPTTNP